MLRNDYLISDATLSADEWTDALTTTELNLWTDGSANESEFDVNWHLLPTERELRDMEADNNTGKLDDVVMWKERRTALRH